MALKTLMLRKKLEQEERKLVELREEKEVLNNEEAELKEAIEELDENSTEEERATVEETVDQLSAKIEDHDKKLKEVEGAIEKIKAEIELEEETPDEEESTTETSERAEVPTITKRSYEGVKNMVIERGMNDMDFQTRDRLLRLNMEQENRDFFTNLKDLYLGRAAALGGMSPTDAQLLLPEDIVFEINQRVGEYGALYNLVRKIPLKGHARIIINADTVKMFWTEKCEPLKETVLPTLRQVEIDNFKLGGYLFLCEAFVEDVDANTQNGLTMQNFILNEFAKAIAQELDRVIYEGKGATAKEPEGITMHVKKTTEVDGVLGVLGAIGEIEVDYLQHNAPNGTVSVVGNRSTLYKYILPETWGKDANGRLVYGMGNALPDGTRIVYSNVIPDGELVIGDFNQYVLGVRKEMSFDTNDRLQWIEENIGYKIRGRYDGKPINPKAFTRVKFKAGTATTNPTTGE